MMNLSTIPVVILAGGKGARFDHESQVLPKPLIEVAGKPILRHIIDSFVQQGFREFYIAGGYLVNEINRYFVETGKGPFAYGIGDLIWWQFGVECEDCGIKVVVVDTGEECHTGGRVAKLRQFLDKTFVLTYGDGLSDVDMDDVIGHHLRDYTKLSWCQYEDGTVADHPAHKPPLVTLTAVNPPGRFGTLRFNPAYQHHVRAFLEKGNDEWINGGFMVMEPEFIDRYLIEDAGVRQLENEALPMAAAEWRLRAHKHTGYWQCMDTRRDLEQIEQDVEDYGCMPWTGK